MRIRPVFPDLVTYIEFFFFQRLKYINKIFCDQIFVLIYYGGFFYCVLNSEGLVNHCYSMIDVHYLHKLGPHK